MLNIICRKCRKDFEGDHPGYCIVFDKCQGKTCPDCNKVRRLGKVKTLQWKGTKFGCIKCHKTSSAIFNSICKECFYEDQKEKGCVCPFEKEETFYTYYCSLCEEFHDLNGAICKDCVQKQDVYIQRKRVFFRVFLPSVTGGIIIGFFLGWLFLVKLSRKKPKISRL